MRLNFLVGEKVLRDIISRFRYLNEKKEIEKFREDNEICFVYFGDDEKGIKTFEKASKLIEDYPFSIVNNEQLIKKYSHKGTIVLFKHFDEKKMY